MTVRRYRDSTAVDFAVVGSGAAGGVVARELAMAGFSVVVLEQGSRLTPADFEHDELKYWFNAGITNDPARSPQSFRSDAAAIAMPTGVKPALWYARTVGGSCTHFTANYWRFHESDFVERSRLGSIAGSGFEDWPITYAELEPYYTKVEWDIGVSGMAGASPFDPPRSRGYPMPPLPVKSSGVLLERGARKLGLHPFPAPMAINSQYYRGRPACMHCGFCHGFACEMQAKSSTLFNMIPEAEATGRCEIRTNSYVVRIDSDAKGRATGVAYFDIHGLERFQKARAVVVCANGAETPRLLLASASARFPDGLANSSGLVGKYLMFNYASRVDAVFEHDLNEFKSVQVTRIVHDFYETDPRRGYYGGGGLDGRIGPQPAVWAQRQSAGGPGWGAAFKARLREFPRSMVVARHGTSLPVASNAVSLDPTLKDAWGRPAIRVTRAPIREQNSSMHLLGTCRMGNDARSSVVDRYHRAHDVPNLFLCDGSSLVTSGRGQPTMTIQAVAFRAAEPIARFARAGEI